jgi:magnesium-transporting ATPase (P-type)
MLTGESVPISKVSIDSSSSSLFSFKATHRHILFFGTDVIQTKVISSNPFLSHNDKVFALVLRTGFNSFKG